MSRAGIAPALMLVAAITGIAIYLPGLQGPFLFDDFTNILLNRFVAISSLDVVSLRDAAYSSGGWFPDRGLARISFALNYYFAGGEFESFDFKLTNLLIHVVNGWLVYALSCVLLERYAAGARRRYAESGWSALRGYLPVVVAGLWLLHPIQLTSVLYVVQRMTSLAAMCVFFGLWVFVLGRSRYEEGVFGGVLWMGAGLVFGGSVGYFFKESAVLLPYLALLVEVFFFRRERLSVRRRRRLYVFYLLMAGVPAVVMVGILVSDPGFVLDTYVNRNFGLYERVLTQSRVLIFYLSLLVFPQIQRFGLYHDDMVVSGGLLEPWTTLASLLLWLGIAVAMWWGVRRRSVWAFGVLWYLVGHALESTIIGLELVHEHRNYVPSYGIVLVMVFYLARWFERMESWRLWRPVLLGMLVGVFGFATFVRAGIWSDRQTLLDFSLLNHPDSSRTHGTYASVAVHYQRDFARGFRHWLQAARLNPDEALGLIEAQKILAGYLVALEAGEHGEFRRGARSPPADLFGAELLGERDYLSRLAGRLSQETLTRLGSRPVETSTVSALRALTTCVTETPRPCRLLLPAAIEWLRAAMRNPYLRQSDRAILSAQLARLHGARGQFAEAIDHARRAVELDREELRFLLELARLNLAAGRASQAGAALDAARALGNPLGLYAEEMRSLSRAIEAREGDG